MTDQFAGLATYNISDHGDSRERDSWGIVGGPLSNYESFWRTLIVLLTNRIDSNVPPGKDWVRLRASIPEDYEKLAMHNYSLLYYMATARRVIEENGNRLASGKHPLPEQTFLALQAAVEQVKKLQIAARDILRELGTRPKFPKQPESMCRTIGAYRNALAHDPVLGRAVDHGRELLPPETLLPDEGKPLLWSASSRIPISDMVDGHDLEKGLWQRLADALQKLWSALTEEFVRAREVEKFRSDLGLSPLLPIRRPPEPASLRGPMAASGVISARSDAH